MKTIFVCGLTQSGKGLLRLLLDGNSGIVASPFGGLGCGLFLPKFSDFLEKKKRRRQWDRIQFEDPDTKKIIVEDSAGRCEIRISELLEFLICDGVGFGDFIDLSLKKKMRADRNHDAAIYTKFNSNVFETLDDFPKNCLS
jgi:hypothetical protein